jgi:hypothetical protein
MTTSALVLPRADEPGRGGFARAVRAEWTKVRTVRGWVAGAILAAVLMIALGVLTGTSISIGCQDGPDAPVLTGAACRLAIPTGPGGEAVVDAYELVGQPLTGDGTLTARVTSVTGLRLGGEVAAGGPGVGTANVTEPWSKVGIILTATTNPGSAYAALMVTGGHGVRLQSDYTGDTAGLPGVASPSSPRWLRLDRVGDTVTGYDSTDGVHWNRVGSTHLAGLPTTITVGLFAASPDHLESNRSVGASTVHAGPTVATGDFDQVSLRGVAPGRWTSSVVGASRQAPPGADGARQAGGRFVVTGSGDLAPVVPGVGSGPVATLESHLVGAFAGLIALGVVATLVATSEYRRGLVRVTLAATPRRWRVLAAKALVVAAVGFAVGLAATVVSLAVGVPMATAAGLDELPVGGWTEARVVVGTAALFALVAVLALAVGTMVRRSAVAVAAVLVAVVAPYLLAVVPLLPVSTAAWLLRITPAAGFAVEQSIPQYAQVSAAYGPPEFFPLPWWAGIGVLCGYAAAALLGAHVMLRRRDA